MSAVCARAVRLTASQRDRLKKVARGHKSVYRDRLRAQIVLDAAADYPNAAVARRRRVGVDTVRKWRGRFAAEGMAGLIDRIGAIREAIRQEWSGGIERTERIERTDRSGPT
jgi:hypothetical protein